MTLEHQIAALLCEHGNGEQIRYFNEMLKGTIKPQVVKFDHSKSSWWTAMGWENADDVVKDICEYIENKPDRDTISEGIEDLMNDVKATKVACTLAALAIDQFKFKMVLNAAGYHEK